MMKNLRFFLLGVGGILFLAACSLYSQAPSSDIQKRDVPFYVRNAGQAPFKRIMVLPFLDEKLDRSQKVAEMSRAVVVQKLLSTGRIVVVKNSDFPQSLNHFLTADREYDMEEISRFAAKMGVPVIFEGKIMGIHVRRMGDGVGLISKSQVQVDTTVRMRMYATKANREIFHDTYQVTTESEIVHLGKYTSPSRFLEEDPLLIRDGVAKAFNSALDSVLKAAEKLTWEGRIAMVSGNKIYLNAGRQSGLQVGDVLKVTEKEEEVFDPDTGRFIGTAPGRMKGTIELTSYFGQDGAIAVVRSGSGFRENDRVELY